MATVTVTPPVDCGRAAPRSTNSQRHRTICRVRFEQTDYGYAAQGLNIVLIEDTPPYWTVVIPDGQRSERSLHKLVTWLVANGHLKAGES